MELELSKTFTFEAAHMLPKHKGKCRFLHGHSWKLRVYVKDVVNEKTGFVMDYADIKTSVQPIIDRLDHHFLGAWTDLFYKPLLERHKDQLVEGLPDDFYPSSENLVVWIADELTIYDAQTGYSEVGKIWSKLELDETCTSRCILTREEYETISRS